MLGFVTFLIPDLLGKPILQQITAAPQAVLLVFTSLTIASFVPIYREGEKDPGYYLDQYSLPADIFSEENERAIGRLAMTGLGTIIFLELLLGRALL